MPSDPSNERATKVTGELLFGLCTATALAIFFLDSSLAEKRQDYSERWDRHEAHSAALRRLREFRAKDSSLFSALVSSSFKIASLSENASNYPTLAPSTRTADGSTQFFRIPPALEWELKRSSQSFGVLAAAAFAKRQSASDLSRDLREAVTRAFTNREATAYLNAEVIPKLKAINEIQGSSGIAWWIAQDEWPQIGGLHVDPLPGVGFGKRFPDRPSDYSDRFYLYELIRFEHDLPTVEHELLTTWKESYAALQAPSGTPERIGLPVLGMSLTVESFLAAIAPVLVLFQLLFVVHWERRSKLQESFDFPSYACPNDPLDAPTPKTLGEGFQRVVWMLFLVFPICLFAVGLLFRYDVGYILGYLNGSSTTLVDAVQQGRSGDLLSSTVDWITLACIAMSAINLLAITRDLSKPPSTSDPRTERVRLAIGWSVAVTTASACCVATWVAYSALLRPISNAADVEFRLQYLVAFGVEFSLLLGLALHRRARFVQLIAVGGLLLFALHFVPLW